MYPQVSNKEEEMKIIRETKGERGERGGERWSRVTVQGVVNQI